jgi:phage shock protein C
MTETDPFRSPNPHRLYKNPDDGRLAGVCAGIADYLSVDPWVVRLVFLVGAVIFTPGFLMIYVILAAALKRRPRHVYRSLDEEMFWRSVTLKPEQTLAGLRARFRGLDRQIAGLEGYVTSREYELNRQFRDLEK